MKMMNNARSLFSFLNLVWIVDLVYNSNYSVSFDKRENIMLYILLLILLLPYKENIK